jgi:hypothetical protein
MNSLRSCGLFNSKNSEEELTMLKIMRIALAILIFCATASAQDNPKVEFFNSYSYAFGSYGNAPGWLTSFAVNRSRYHGYFGEFSRHYRAVRVQTYNGEFKDIKDFSALLLGVQVYIKKQNPISPFIRLTIGGTSEPMPIKGQGGRSFTTSPTILLGAGGGVDIRLPGHFAFRAFQIDHLNPGPDKPKRVRLSTGLVLRF